MKFLSNLELLFFSNEKYVKTYHFFLLQWQIFNILYLYKEYKKVIYFMHLCFPPSLIFLFFLLQWPGVTHMFVYGIHEFCCALRGCIGACTVDILECSVWYRSYFFNCSAWQCLPGIVIFSSVLLTVVECVCGAHIHAQNCNVFWLPCLYVFSCS